MSSWKSVFGGKAEHSSLDIFVPSMGTKLEESIRCYVAGNSDPETELDMGLLREEEGNVQYGVGDLPLLSEKYGIALSLKKKSVRSLSELACPCILVFENGLTAILEAASDTKVTISIRQRTIEARAKEVLRVTTQVIEIAGAGMYSPKPARNKKDREEAPKPHTAPQMKTISKAPELAGENKYAILQLCRYVLRKHSGTISLILVAAFISNLMMIALPLFIMSVYDRVIPHSALETLWALALGVVIALSIDLGVRHVRLKLADAVSLSVSGALQARLLDVLSRSKMSVTPRRTSVWTACFRDLDITVGLIPSLIPAILIDLPVVCIVLGLIYFIAGPVVFAPIAGIFFLSIWTLLGIQTMRRDGAEESKHSNMKTEMLAETATVIRTLKTIGAERSRVAQFQALLRDGMQSAHSLRLHGGFQPTVTMLSVQVITVFAVVIGVYQIAEGLMSVGALAASTLLVGRVLLPAGSVVTLTGRVSQVSKSFENICRVLNLPQEEGLDQQSGRKVTSGKLSLSNVGFKFGGSPVNALSEINVTIQPGEKVAIIGRSGSGKSTLLQMLVRLYEPEQGAFTIDDFDARQYAPHDVRQALSYMPQETDLIAGTISDNLLLAHPKASQEDLLRALEIASADEFVKTSPFGLSMQVGRNGECLSGGERQAIGLARAVLRPSKMLLLDEPTSAFDNTTEARVIKSLADNLQGRTLLVATHRVSLLSIVDRVIWMDRGRIVADGPRDQVLAKLRSAA